ncbi:hypothetical protein V6N12_044595 [Hibiscus sabdariffa]|uniref:ARID domain-containing protein n=1 Tax=Hibiscus sabdariffa TaxID=183260 RepID=A0ABR2AKV1_9ROSI
MTSTSFAKQNVVPLKEPVSSYTPYPPALARYEDVVACPELFLATLEKLHATMGTKFMIPIIGGKELDLHKLFVEVTSRGGIEKLVRERRWKQVTAMFNFPSTATNASFVLRKSSSKPNLFHRFLLKVQYGRTVEIHAAAVQQPRVNIAESSAEKLKGVLYQAPKDAAPQVPHQYGAYSGRSDTFHASSGVQRRRRRKKSEIRRRDPAHPKPNRSGYNFFFAEQHARLKPLHPGKDREISRMIG